MVLRQTRLSLWRRHYQRQPGSDGAGSSASKGPTEATGASVNLTVRGEQSRATDHKHPPNLTIIQWNAEGIQNKKPELQEFARKMKADIICVQETHLKEHLRFFLRGYETFRMDRPDRHKGGILTLVKISIPAVEISRSDRDDLEHLTIKAMLPGGDLHITNCYSPPNTTLGVNNLMAEEKRHIIVGDFNSHSPSWGYQEIDLRGGELEDWMIDNKMILINHPDDKPTFYSRAWKKSSSPDLAFATEDTQRLTTRRVESQLGGSDHVPIILSLASSGCTETRNMEPSWNFKKAKWPVFREHMDKLCKDQPVSTSNDINRNVTLFTSLVLQAAKVAIPRGKRRDYKPYWSDTLEELHTDLNKAREIMEHNPTLENTQSHNEIRDAFNKQKRTELQNSWGEKTSSLNMERDVSKLWNLTKALNEDAETRHCKTVIEENGQFYAGKMAANILADFYKEESTTKIPPARQKEVCKKIKDQLKEQDPTSPMTVDLSIKELRQAARQLKRRKAPGKDGITNEMIQHLGPAAMEALLLIFNQSWQIGKFPDGWREAIVIPIRKKNKDKTKKSSYRPISLLSCLGKLMERMVNARLMKHLEQNHHINDCQSAFRKNRSTEDQLLYITQEIENAFQEKKKVVAIFVDLTKAFDKVWKEGLQLKLLNSKVEGKMYKWIQNFLQHRTARVKLDGKMSHRVNMQQGVPQGGVLSPTLFNIFINDITSGLSNHISRALHADDFAAWHAAESLPTARIRMQEALDAIGKWAADWGVEINTTKTVSTVFSLSNNTESINLRLHDNEIEQTHTPTYLGVKLDKRLTWMPHLKEVETRAIKRLALMKKLAGTSWGANGKILRRVYTGTVRPILEYGTSAWATSAKTNTNRLSKVQNTGLRLITGGIKSTPIREMERHTSLRNLENRREEKVYVQSEKLHRMLDHPLRSLIRKPTKNRLKRSSFNHIQRALHKDHEDLLPSIQEEMEVLKHFDEPEYYKECVKVNTSVPGIGKKSDQTPQDMKALTLEMIDREYNPSEWTHAYTDGSSEGAVKNGGGGYFIRHLNRATKEKAFPVGKISSNFRAESAALLRAIEAISEDSSQPPNKTVFFTDCRSLLEDLNNARNEAQVQELKKALNRLAQHTTVVLQWLPSHCGISGNEKADTLSKQGSAMEQPGHRVTYREAKTIARSVFGQEWRSSRGDLSNDPYHQLERHQQTIIFRLRTGHCRLLGHLHRIKLAHDSECPCKTGVQDTHHILQHCPLYERERRQVWPQGADVNLKLWGTGHDLERTVDFIVTTGLRV